MSKCGVADAVQTQRIGENFDKDIVASRTSHNCADFGNFHAWLLDSEKFLPLYPSAPIPQTNLPFKNECFVLFDKTKVPRFERRISQGEGQSVSFSQSPSWL